MKITDIHEVAIYFHVGGIVLKEDIDTQYFQNQVINQRMQEGSLYIAISKTFLEIAVKSLSAFSERPNKFVFSYKDADDYKHIMVL